MAQIENDKCSNYYASKASFSVLLDVYVVLGTVYHDMLIDRREQ